MTKSLLSYSFLFTIKNSTDIFSSGTLYNSEKYFLYNTSWNCLFSSDFVFLFHPDLLVLMSIILKDWVGS